MRIVRKLRHWYYLATLRKLNSLPFVHRIQSLPIPDFRVPVLLRGYLLYRMLFDLLLGLKMRHKHRILNRMPVMLTLNLFAILQVNNASMMGVPSVKASRIVIRIIFEKLMITRDRLKECEGGEAKYMYSMRKENRPPKFNQNVRLDQRGMCMNYERLPCFGEIFIMLTPRT
jgi:hypothetical protein